MTQELLRYHAGRSESECPHKLTEDNIKALVELMPYSKSALENLPLEVLKPLLWVFGHNVSYSNDFNSTRRGCSFQLPFDSRHSYYGETAPYCGHAYSGTTTNFIGFIKEVGVSKEDKEEHDYSHRVLRRFVIAMVQFGDHIPESYDHMDVVSPMGIERYFYTFEQYSHPMSKDTYWGEETIREKEFDHLRDFGLQIEA